MLEDYVYFANKAVNQFINKVYNAYDVNQQKTDDLRVLKGSAVLTPVISTEWTTSALLDKTYDLDLPDDYLHILNCIVEYNVLKGYKCYTTGTKFQIGAKRLTADMFSQIIQNYYMKPSYKNPYYFINNVNVSSVYPTTDNQVKIITADPVRVSENRYGNKSKVRMEIRYGKDNLIFQLSKVYIDYLKTPQYIQLTQEQVDGVEDTSQLLEFPDYVAQEIVNELIHLLMENGSDPRLQSHIPINQSIAPPAVPGQQQKR